jgi:hypothetical protein
MQHSAKNSGFAIDVFDMISDIFVAYNLSWSGFGEKIIDDGETLSDMED